MYVGMRAVDVLASITTGGSRVSLNEPGRVILGLCGILVIVAAIAGVGTAIMGGATAPMVEPGLY